MLSSYVHRALPPFATLLASSAPPLKKCWAALYFCSCCFSSLLVFYNLPLSTERHDWEKELFFLLSLSLCIFAQQTTLWPFISVLVRRKFIANVKPQAFLWSVSAVFRRDLRKTILVVRSWVTFSHLLFLLKVSTKAQGVKKIA